MCAFKFFPSCNCLSAKALLSNLAPLRESLLESVSPTLDIDRSALIGRLSDSENPKRVQLSLFN